MSKSRRFVGAFQDMGCLENTLPVLLHLKNSGHNVAMFINTLQGVAKDKVVSCAVETNNIPVIAGLEAGDVLITCLPTWSMEILPSEVPVVLIPENALVSDARLTEWLQVPPFRLSVVGLPITGADVIETGLPAIARAAEQIKAVPENAFDLWVGKNEFIISAALPGDLGGCMRMIKALQAATMQREHTVIFARSHPKLKNANPADFSSVAQELAKLPAIPLADANKNHGPIEQMAVGRNGLFVCDWNSTMALQATAAGIPVGIIPPVDQDPIEWVTQNALLQNRNAVPFMGVHPFWDLQRLRPLDLMDGSPVKNIADVAVKIATT